MKVQPNDVRYMVIHTRSKSVSLKGFRSYQAAVSRLPGPDYSVIPYIANRHIHDNLKRVTA